MKQVSKVFKTVSVTPTVSTSPAYEASDQVGGIQTLENAMRSGGTAILQGVTVVDAGKQNAALTIFFFKSLPTVASVDNGATTITDAELKKSVGHITVAADDYEDVAGGSVASVKNVNLPLASGAQGHLYAVVMTTGTPTYASTTDLVFTYSFEQAD